jgi:SAM-dependent methyltransferase
MPSGPRRLRPGCPDNVRGMASRAERSTSFGSIASEYDRLRPPPAEDAVEWLVPGRRQTLVDIGAGTGLLTRALARHAQYVVAVEPDARMRQVLRARSPDVEVLAGRGEAIPLPDASADGVYASSAWHWMDPDQAVPEIARVLRDGGRFGLIWTTREHDIPWLRRDDWFREIHEQDHHPRSRGNRRRRMDFPPGSPFASIETAAFRYIRPMTPADIVDMLTTYSEVITADPDSVAAGRARATAALARQFPGQATIDVPTVSYCARADRTPR